MARREALGQGLRDQGEFRDGIQGLDMGKP
jgi:hypothetical protein